MNDVKYGSGGYEEYCIDLEKKIKQLQAKNEKKNKAIKKAINYITMWGEGVPLNGREMVAKKVLEKALENKK